MRQEQGWADSGFVSAAPAEGGLLVSFVRTDSRLTPTLLGRLWYWAGYT